jgi:hydroxyethylthiazole kinase-like uncharacterized protein yjeF
MTELLTAAQMRAIEQAAIASGEVTGLELMERAGRGVVEAILEWRPELATAPHKAVVLCGPGNNGGDGFVVARLLKQRGWEVEVFLYGDEAKLPPDAAENCRRWREMGEVEPWSGDVSASLWGAGLIVDAVFGTGLKRELPESIKAEMLILGKIFLFHDRTVAIDAPSGLCLDSGRVLGNHTGCLPVGLTVAFEFAKAGHFLSDGPNRCGELVVKPIGIERFSKQCFALTAQEEILSISHCTVHKQAGLALSDLGKGKSLEELISNSSPHKYTHGHALILSGGVGKGGAARLAARGALRIGAGLVTLGPPPAAIIENAAQLNAIMLRPVADADALAVVLKDERFNAVCLGPGLGVGAHTLGLVAATLAAKRGTVLDADALTSFAEDPSKLFALLHDKCVLTPHLGEFARLFPDIAEKLAAPAAKGPAYSKVDATREAAARAGCTILLKGPDTVIANPEGRAAINSAHYERAAPWLATAGSGDVLAGMITGLLARGFNPMTAAETAAWLHVEAARKFGPGLIAEDLPEMIPAVFRDLGL